MVRTRIIPTDLCDETTHSIRTRTDDHTNGYAMEHGAVCPHLVANVMSSRSSILNPRVFRALTKREQGTARLP